MSHLATTSVVRGGVGCLTGSKGAAQRSRLVR